MAGRHAIGIDLGGTNLRWAVVDSEGKLSCQGSLPRPREADEIAAAQRLAVEHCREQQPDAAGAGIALPGIIADGRITSYNLGWIDFAIQERLAGLPVPVSLLNDMAAGALGELHFGR